MGEWGGAGKEQKPRKEETLFAKVFCERDGSHGTFCSSFFLLLSFYNLSGHSFAIETPHFIPIHFIALHRHCVF